MWLDCLVFCERGFCLPSDALSQCLPSYWSFSDLGHGGTARKTNMEAGSREGCRPGAEPQEPQLAATRQHGSAYAQGSDDAWFLAVQLKRGVVTANHSPAISSIHPLALSLLHSFQLFLEYPWCARYHYSPQDGLVSKVDRFLSSRNGNTVFHWL